MKKCNKNNCVCSTIEDKEKENLDIISEENINNNFANVWIVLGDMKNTKNIRVDKDFKAELKDTANINKNQPTQQVRIMYNEDNKVTYAILPRILDKSEKQKKEI